MKGVAASAAEETFGEVRVDARRVEAGEGAREAFGNGLRLAALRIRRRGQRGRLRRGDGGEEALGRGRGGGRLGARAPAREAGAEHRQSEAGESAIESEGESGFQHRAGTTRGR